MGSLATQIPNCSIDHMGVRLSDLQLKCKMSRNNNDSAKYPQFSIKQGNSCFRCMFYLSCHYSYIDMSDR